MNEIPDYSKDLDGQVSRAIVAHDPNRLAQTSGNRYSPDPSLLVTAAHHGRLDLVEDLIATGAVVQKEDVFSCLRTRSVRSLLLRYCPLAPDDYTARLHNHLWGRGEPDWEMIAIYLDYGAEPNCARTKCTFCRDVTLLHSAAWTGNTDMVERLLSLGAIINAMDFIKFTPLMRACYFESEKHRANVGVVFWLLEYGADPNGLTESGESPLLLCLKHKLNKREGLYERRSSIARLLVKRGADPNILSPAKTTPLMLAARDNDFLLVKALLDAGADPTVRSPNGKTALDVARDRNHKEVEFLLRS